MSILARLFILVAIAVLPALAIEGFNQFDLRQERGREIRRNALRLATFAAGELDRIIESGAGLLSGLSRLPAIRNFDAAACSSYLADLGQVFPQYRVIGATDARGNVFCASKPPPPGFSLSDKPAWRQAMQTGEFTVGVYNLGKLANAPILPLSLAFRDESGAIAGLVYVSLDLEWLTRYFADKQFDKDATLLIADRNATILLRLPDNERFVGTAFAETYRRYVFAAEAGTDEIDGVDGVRRILGYVPVTQPPNGLYIGIGLSRQSAFAAIDHATLKGIAMISAGFFLALVAAWIGGRQFISRPIARLADAAGHWRRGDFRVRVAAVGGGEIGLLANAFNDMAVTLADKQQENAALLATLEQRVDDRTRDLAREAAERRRAEEALLQAQKMEAIGQLTGGIAHDFNNLLMAVLGNLELAETRFGGAGTHPALRYLVQARRSAERGARLTRDLLAFARRQSLDVALLDLNTVVRHTDELLRRSVGGPVRIDHRLAPDLWPALGDASQIELVILNLIINARDAMPGGGAITIETGNMEAAALRRLAGLPSGDYVRLAVSDTGSGMTDEVLAKCLEPFFTTKEVGKGSGLGLSVVHGIATQSGGTVEIGSEVGRGTVVNVYLPRAEAEIAADREPGNAAPAPGNALSDAPRDVPSGARVLLVDDDPDVRDIVTAQLRELGCAVVPVTNGHAALDLLDRDNVAGFDLLISDYAMPGFSGAELAAAVRERWPKLPVLLITGYNDIAPGDIAAGDIAAGARPGQGWDWLQKPFRQAELAGHVRRLVAPKRPNATSAA
jgi:signal transduction histidine kinase/CheY-like chemotaxis protein